MGRASGAHTWRLVRLTGWATAPPCRHCGRTHEYFVRPKHGGACQPVLFPPGFASAGLGGVEVEVFSVAPDDLAGSAQEEAAYRRLARQVAERGIRCERCGERFEELDRYAGHHC
jgi:ribosomal protein L37E